MLRAGDEEALEAFLVRHADSSMFLRSNWRRGGLEFRGQEFGGDYVARWHDGAITGVACHAWQGMILVQAPGDDGELARAAAAASGRSVRGFSGPAAHVTTARRALGLDAAPADLATTDVLMTLDLEHLAPPPRLIAGEVVCRHPRDADLEQVAMWRGAYHVETLGRDPETVDPVEIRAEVDAWRRDDRLWVLEEAGVLVAMTGFNARLPDSVQVGGVYTPPALRRRGHAQAVVAGSLLDARAGGTRRAILFTSVDNAASQAAYRRIGFEVTGDYSLVLLR